MSIKNNKLSLLYERTKNLKEKVLSREISLLEEDLEAIFKDLKKLITSSDLKTAISVMEDGTLILEQKIDEIQRFIALLTQQSGIIKFLQRYPNSNEFYWILQKVWYNPINLPQFSTSFLNKSWVELVKKKKKRSVIDEIDISPIHQGKEVNILDISEDPFDIQMKVYFNSLKLKLPGTLDKILEFDNQDEYFEHFSYILHLLQEGSISYNHKLKLFSYNPTDDKKNE